MQFETSPRNDKFQQSERSTSVAGPQKHFKLGYVATYVASMGDAVAAVVEVVGEGDGAEWQKDFAEKNTPRFFRHVQDV